MSETIPTSIIFFNCLLVLLCLNLGNATLSKSDKKDSKSRVKGKNNKFIQEALQYLERVYILVHKCNLVDVVCPLK